MSDPFDVSEFTKAAAYQADPSGADCGLYVRFFSDEMKDEKASAEAGRPIFKSVEMCEIRYGDRDNVVIDRVVKMDPDPRKRFAAQYAQFKAGAPEQLIGTPLREWQALDRATARSYEAVGIFTVEQLSELADTHAAQYRGLVAHRQMARDFLAKARGEEVESRLRAEADELRTQLAHLQAFVESRLGEKAPELTLPAKVRRKPGPKPKGPPPQEA